MTGSPGIAFRVDAGAAIGSGHVVRCLTLADALREQGASPRFLCRAHEGHMAEFIRMRGYPVTLMPLSDDCPGDGYAAWLGAPWHRDVTETLSGLCADWLVIDHYGIDARWHAVAREHVPRIAAIDDVANRSLDCDVLLDQNYGRAPEDYAALVPAGCTVLAGTDFALLRPEFREMRAVARARRAEGHLNRILVTMGGVDATNATGRALEALADCALPPGLKVTVVMGGAALHADAVRDQAPHMPFDIDIRTGVRDMATLMAECDLAICASGSTLWEMCCLGLPFVAVVTAENQRPAAQRLRAAGLALTIEEETDDWHVRIFEAISRSDWRSDMSTRIAEVVDGQGAYRVGKCVLGLSS